MKVEFELEIAVKIQNIFSAIICLHTLMCSLDLDQLAGEGFVCFNCLSCREYSLGNMLIDCLGCSQLQYGM